jgi:hypothetical protein
MQPAGMNMSLRLRFSGVMLAKALPLMVIVYLLFPRISGTLWACRRMRMADSPACRT